MCVVTASDVKARPARLPDHLSMYELALGSRGLQDSASLGRDSMLQLLPEGSICCLKDL